MINNLLDYIRFALYGVIVIVLIFLYQAWKEDHPEKRQVNEPTTKTATNNNIPDIQNIVDKKQTLVDQDVKQPIAQQSEHKNIEITTDVIKVSINPLGGNINKVELLDYPESLHSEEPFLLLNNNPKTRYLAQSGLLSSKGPDTSKKQAIYTSEKQSYVLQKNQDGLEVVLNWKNQDGIIVSKIFKFTKGSYEIDLDYKIQNNTSSAWQGNLYLQLLRENNPPESTGGFVSFATYFGAAISSPDKKFKKISFTDMNKQNLNKEINGGWAAMIQHYFVSAWVPNENVTSNYFTAVNPDGLYTIGMIGPEINLQPGQGGQASAKFYAGPAIAEYLDPVAPSLKLTIDYGWFWFISAIIFWMMQHIYNVVGNWGWSIVIVTLIIKLMFYKLSAKSYRSMSGLKKLQPKINALKERFGDDKQKFTQATLELYKKEKVNPMSGCLPILVQIPVFIGLYWVLIESVQLRHAPFILWIHDLSIKDPYYVLPVLMGLSMLLQQRLNPPPPDPVQAKVMMLMPVVFTALFLNFPAGLMLYWFVNNSLSFLQQWYIMRSMNNDGNKTKK